MSKQVRKVAIRSTDWAVIQVLKMALAQYGVRVRKNSYFTITGNKSNGAVKVETYNNTGTVFLDGEGAFLRIFKVQITTLNGDVLDEPKIIEFRNFGGSDISLPFALQLTEHRNSVIYQLVGQSEGFDTAISLLHFLQEYPKVVMDREEIKLIYRPGELGIDKLVLWYHRHRGYTHALIIYDDGRVRRFRCDWLTYIWTEQK